jgi:hypothetical protein
MGLLVLPFSALVDTGIQRSAWFWSTRGGHSLHTPEGRLTRQSLPGPLEVNVGLDFHRRSRGGNADEGQIEGHARRAGSGDRDIERASGQLAR